MRLVEQLVGARFLLGELRVERLVERDDDHARRRRSSPPLGREPGRHVHRLSRLRPLDDGHEDRLVLERDRGAEQSGARTVAVSGTCTKRRR